jgi:hypothetical protein
MRVPSTVVAAFALGALLGDKKDSDFAREGDPRRREALDAMEGKAPPALQVEKWLNAEPLDFEKLRGKVVLLDFWGNW